MFSQTASDYAIKSELAICCNGIATVLMAQYIPTGEFVSVKKYKMDKTKDETDNLHITNEVLTMRQFNHPHILTFYSTFVSNLDVVLVAPIMCFGSCRDLLNNFFVAGLPEVVVSLVLRDVLLGLEYLHRKGFIHRSIRASHILVDRRKAVLSGFRECTGMLSNGERTRTLHELPSRSMKNLNWLAPEVLEQNLLGYTEKSDVYSVGITTCELANSLEPFADMPTTFMLTEKIRGNTPALLDSSTCPPPLATDSGVGDSLAETRQTYGTRTLSDHFHKFAEICMSRFPIERPSVSQLMNHHFFRQTRQTTLGDQLIASGVDHLDCTKHKDEAAMLNNDFGDISISGTFEWDF